MMNVLMAFLMSLAAVKGQHDEMYRRSEFYDFASKVEKSLQIVKSVLESHRNPHLLGDDASDHTWNDKFTVAEVVTNAAISSTLLTLQNMLDISQNDLETIQQWAIQDKKSVMLRFQAKDTFVFNREVLASVDLGKTDDETMWEHFTRPKKQTKRTEYHWKAGISYDLIVCRGSCDGDDNKITLIERKRTATIITLSKYPHPPEMTKHDPLDLNLTWLINMVEPGKTLAGFQINRDLDTCRTPSRNKDVELAFVFYTNLSSWVRYGILNSMIDRLQKELADLHQPIKPTKTTPLSALSSSGDLFVPIQPLIENGTALALDTTLQLHDEQAQRIRKSKSTLEENFPAPDSENTLISTNEAFLVKMAYHIKDLSEQYKDAIAYVEGSLHQQLIQAIGKEIKPKDFQGFMHQYNQKLFQHEYAPVPFSHAIRRPERYPDGLISIEDNDDEPVQTLVRFVPSNNTSPMQVPINAATTVELSGDRFLHGWMQQQYDTMLPISILTARARQFSSFLILIGGMAGPNKFIPKKAIILKNKDDVIIPLITEILPSAKEFKDAIASLSPEQQDFAREIRSLQLEPSVFAIGVVQLKPQLEKLLGLPNGALTKEIQLTEDLLSLFIDYQIPSDLLSYDGDINVSMSTKLDAVKKYVKAVMDMVENTKKKQLEEQKDQARAATYDTIKKHSGPPYVAPSGVPAAMPSAAPSAMPSAGPSSRSRMVEKEIKKEWRRKMLRLHPDKAQSAASVEMMEESIPDYLSSTKEEQMYQEDNSSAMSRLDYNDFSQIPKQLDETFNKYDTDGALKSVIVDTGLPWIRERQENFILPMEWSTLSSSEISNENKQAMDLLDAISRSGSLPIEATELHVIISVAYCFEKSIIETVVQDNINPIVKLEKEMLMLSSTKSIIDTVVQDNINPIVKLEKALLMLSSTIYGGVPAQVLLKSGTNAFKRLQESLPSYFSSDADKDKTNNVPK